MTKYAEYSSCKDSGVEWLGEIPSDWEVRKLNAVATLKGGGTPNTSVLELWDGGITWVTPKDYTSSNSEYLITSERTITQQGLSVISGLIPKNSVLMTCRAPVGNVAIAGKELAMNQGFIASMPSKAVDFRFLYFVLKAAKNEMQSHSKGGTFQEISRSRMGAVKIPLPPLETQKAIVEFLDAETAHIDAGIANMESLIALLTEKRSALISEAVTRGIPGEHAEFKDSGVAWLGEIPVGWESTDPKNLFVAKSMESLPEDAHLMASQKYGVIPQTDYLKNTGKRVVEVFSENARFKHIDNDDFLIHLRSFQGGIEHCINTGKVTTAYTVVSPNREKIFPLYAKYLLKSKDYISGLASTTNQLRDGQSIKWKDFRKVILPVPSLEEQRKIANFLERELRSLEMVSSEAQATIVIMKEKRQTLISDVVTGKIDVTNTTN